uniref:Uncharacterized protein n=1 Tax=Brassica oleracea var. oleracea TaxID=109376 RepID=A0A0D3DIX7_BRAOL
METKKGRWFRLIRIREIEIENRKRRARWRRTEIEDRSFPNESDDLVSSFHLRLLSSTGVSVGVSLQIERSQLPIERSQLRNLNPLPFDSGPVRKLMVLELMQWTNMSEWVEQLLDDVCTILPPE